MAKWFDDNAPNGEGTAIVTGPTLPRQNLTPVPGYQGGLSNPLTPSLPAPSQPAAPGATAAPGGSATAPALNISDPASVAAYVTWWGQQPGVNPSVARDPNYWIGKISSGELGSDPGYISGKFMAPEGAPSGGGGSMADLGAFPTLAASDPFTYGAGPGPFVAPDKNAVLADPGYQFRLDEGLRALNMSASARGTLKTGGALKDAENYGQNLGSQEYANVFNRDLTQQSLADSEYQSGRSFALQAYTANQDNQVSAYDRAVQAYMQHYAESNNNFSQLFSLSSLGQQAAAAVPGAVAPLPSGPAPLPSVPGSSTAPPSATPPPPPSYFSSVGAPPSF